MPDKLQALINSGRWGNELKRLLSLQKWYEVLELGIGLMDACIHDSAIDMSMAEAYFRMGQELNNSSYTDKANQHLKVLMWRQAELGQSIGSCSAAVLAAANRAPEDAYMHRLLESASNSLQDSTRSIGAMRALWRQGPPLELLSLKQPRGMVNPDVRCYMNAVMQALVACREVWAYLNAHARLIQQLSTGFTPVLHAMACFARDYTAASSRPGVVVDTPQLPDQIIASLFFGEASRQHDAHEYFIKLLSRASADIEVLTARFSDLTPPASTPSMSLESFFTGIVRTTTSYPGTWSYKAYCNPKEVTFNVLSLSIHPDGVCDVWTALLGMAAPAPITYHLDGHGAIPASQTSQISRQPPVLALHLKRFVHNDTTGAATKVSKPIAFTETLQLDTESGILTDDPANASHDVQYVLAATIHHEGQHVNSGHYTANVLCGHTGDRREWVHIDDRKVSSTDWRGVARGTGTVYMLFYQRV